MRIIVIKVQLIIILTVLGIVFGIGSLHSASLLNNVDSRLNLENYPHIDLMDILGFEDECNLSVTPFDATRFSHLMQRDFQLSMGR